MTRAMRIAPGRSLTTLAVILLMFGAMLAGGAYRALGQRDDLRGESNKIYVRVIPIPAIRGAIVDRNGDLLAISAPTYSVYANPEVFRELENADEAIARLAQTLEISAADIRRKLARRNRFVYLRKYLASDIVAKLDDLKIPGVGAERSDRRFYPSGYAAAHVVGFTDYLDRGREGFEFARQPHLSPKPGLRRVFRTADGDEIQEFNRRPSRDGGDLSLTLDLRIQHFALAALARAVKLHGAKAGGVVVLDAQSGEVLTMANYPSFNPNNLGESLAAARRNRAAADVFEPGSAMKPIIAAIALDEKILSADSVLKTKKPIWIQGGLIVRDKNIDENLTVAEIIEKSSNVGAVRIAEKIVPSILWRRLRSFGFGESPGSGFPGEAAGVFRHHSGWYPADRATLGYGHGVSMSLLQLARAYTAFGNGELLPVSLVKGEAARTRRRVISAETAEKMRTMMERVITEDGTAPRAKIPGYRVGGKTGTVIKIENGEYNHSRYQSVFVGFAPATRPRFVAAVIVDEPIRNGYYGGIVAAPVFREVMERALILYAVPPDAEKFSEEKNDGV